MKNIEQAKENMIKQQLKVCSIFNEQILSLADRLPRESFVPAEYSALAYADTPIPLKHGQYMMTPQIEGALLQSLNLKKTEKILEVGTGSGYLTAALSILGQSITSVDIYKDFTKKAADKLANLGIKNATLETGDACYAWKDHQYDVIVLTGSVYERPNAFIAQQLKFGGRLFAIIGQTPTMEATLIEKNNHGLSQKVLFETDLPALINKKQKTKKFVF